MKVVAIGIVSDRLDRAATWGIVPGRPVPLTSHAAGALTTAHWELGAGIVGHAARDQGRGIGWRYWRCCGSGSPPKSSVSNN